MKTMLAGVVLLVTLAAAQNPTWKRYTPGNTGTQGNYAQSILLDTANTFWVASNDPIWDEGGLAYFDGRRFLNWSNVDSTCPSFELGSLRRDAHGNIWAGSPIGLLKFDGSSWTVYNHLVAPFPSDMVRGVDIDSAGNIWFAMSELNYNQGGLGRFNGSTFRFWTVDSGIPWPDPWRGVVRVACAPGGVVYIGSDVVGAARYDGSSWTYYDPWGPNPPPSNQISDIEVQPDGVVWMSDPTSTGRGIGRLERDTWTYGNPPGTRGVSSLEWRNDSLLVGTYGTGVWILHGGNWTSYGGSGSHIYDVHFGTNNTIWACGIGGVGHWVDGSWQGWNVANTSLTERWSDGIDLDRNGNVWISTNGGGICRFDGEAWLDFNPYNGGNPPWPYLTDNTNAAIDDDSGRIWVGTYGQGVVVWDGMNWIRQFYQGGDILNLVRDSTGRIWGNGGSALFLFGMDTFQRYDYQNSPLNSYVTGVCADTGGHVWVTTAWGGLYHTDGVQFDSITPRNSGMPGDGNCRSPVRGADGRVWMGLGAGIAVFDPRDSSWVAFDTSNSPIPFAVNDYLALTSDNVLWFSSQSGEDGALVKFDGSNWTLYTTQNSPLPHWQVWAIAVGPDGRVWVACASQGIAVVDESPGAIEERTTLDDPRRTSRATIVRCALRLDRQLLTDGSRPELVDITGRRVVTLKVGENDVSHVAPGVYFVRTGALRRRVVVVR